MLYVWIFIVSLLASLIAVPWVLIKLPVDYFCPNKKPREPFARFPAAARMPLIVAKNLLGVALVGAGLVFLVMPGQGVIVILIGVLLLDFPRKKQLERWLIARGPILKLANWIRAKGNKEPLVL
ncbi:MAG: PGPGW domain-containing protein [Pseudomonadota bacterium]|nr:PGPGW domain-containing protein [Pseudomonadota bacterium]